MAARGRNRLVPELDRGQAGTERRGLLDAHRQQLEPGAQAFLAASAIGLDSGAFRAHPQRCETGRPTRQLAYFLKPGKARAVVDDLQTLARKEMIDGRMRTHRHRVGYVMRGADKQKCRPG